MMPSSRIAFRLAATVALAAASVCCHAFAQDGEASPPPQPNRALGLVTPVIGYAIMAVAAAALVMVSLLKSRRGAQD